MGEARQHGRDNNLIIQAVNGASVAVNGFKSKDCPDRGRRRLAKSMLKDIRSFRQLFSHLLWLRFNAGHVVVKCTDPSGMMDGMNLKRGAEGHSWRFLMEVAAEEGLIRTVDALNLEDARNRACSHGGTTEVVCRSFCGGIVSVVSISASIKRNRFSGFVVICMMGHLGSGDVQRNLADGRPMLE